MTTPRVTVPVEPTEAMINHAVGHIGGGSTFDTDDRREIAQSVYRAMLSAAPAPEGGAVWFGVTGAADETEALAVALFDVRCPGVRMTDEDLHYYRAAAQRAMQAVTDELDTPALATREEAPAEAGERDYPAEFEAWWATYRHRNRDVADYSVKKQIAFDAFYHAALRARSSAPEALGNLLAVIHGDGGHRALEVGTKQAALEAEKIVAGLFAAPSADKLRGLVGASEDILSALSALSVAGKPIASLDTKLRDAINTLVPALAALRQEGAK